jgi:hypothetical protein
LIDEDSPELEGNGDEDIEIEVGEPSDNDDDDIGSDSGIYDVVYTIRSKYIGWKL